MIFETQTSAKPTFAVLKIHAVTREPNGFIADIDMQLNGISERAPYAVVGEPQTVNERLVIAAVQKWIADGNGISEPDESIESEHVSSGQ